MSIIGITLIILQAILIMLFVVIYLLIRSLEKEIEIIKTDVERLEVKCDEKHCFPDLH